MLLAALHMISGPWNCGCCGAINTAAHYGIEADSYIILCLIDICVKNTYRLFVGILIVRNVCLQDKC